MTGDQLLRRLLELAGADDDANYVLARAGEGLEAVPETLEVAGRRYHVARPATELGLRRLLWQSGGAPCIAIIGADLAGRLPADLLRAAHGGRVHALGPAQVLAAVLGTHVMGVEDEPTLQLALEHLEALRRLLREDAGTPTVLDSRLLDELLAEVSVGRRLGPWVRAPSWHCCWSAPRPGTSGCAPSGSVTCAGAWLRRGAYWPGLWMGRTAWGRCCCTACCWRATTRIRRPSHGARWT
ncbi:MAG: hypothetical protein IPL60_10445 [Ardenticatenia bacterium]|nr:hypothetical protein [Ardenticatenia bacterium]